MGEGEVIIIEYKTCKECKRELPKTNEYFRDDGRTFDGFNTKCNDCNPLKTEYYMQHRDYLRDKVNKWNRENPDLKSERNRKYRQENWDYKNKLDKEWFADNKGYWSEYCREYQQSNPEKFREYAQRRKPKRHKINEQEWKDCKEYFDYSCAYCGFTEQQHIEDYNEQLHKEHVECDGANDLSNCIPSCRNCNSSKHVYPLEIWYSDGNPNYEEDKLNKIYKWLEEDYKLYFVPKKPRKPYTYKNRV